MRRRAYYEKNRYEICKRKMEIYIPQSIDKVKRIMPKTVLEYQAQYIYDERLESYTKYILKRMGVSASRDYYDDCISNSFLGYLYSICMCAMYGYTGTHVRNYIKKMIRVTIICGINTSDEVHQICKENHLSVKYLDDDRRLYPW